MRPLTNKSGHGPRTGLWYQFDATLGYPGEGPSHSLFTRRGTRPSLRVWSTKRPKRHVVDPIRVRLDFNPIPLATKVDHGNSDTRLGRWLQSSRSPLITGLSRSDFHRGNHEVEKNVAPPPVSTVSVPAGRVSSITTPSMRADDVSAGVVSSTSTGLTEHSETRRISSPRDTSAQSLPRYDAVVTTSLSRREFIRKFALQRGVTGAALDAIWQLNKRGYNTSHDAHFDLFQVFFRDTKPDCEFTPLSILPGDLVTFLQTME
jgi:hypothetical protein